MVLKNASTLEQCLAVVSSEGAAGVIVDLAAGPDVIAEIAQAVPASVLQRSIAFGPHVHESRLQQARDAGFGKVVSRGQFVAQHAGLLQAAAGISK